MRLRREQLAEPAFGAPASGLVVVAAAAAASGQVGGLCGGPGGASDSTEDPEVESGQAEAGQVWPNRRGPCRVFLVQEMLQS